MRKQIKSIKSLFTAALLAGGVFSATSCEEFLDVNTNPNGPDQMVSPHLYLPAIQSELALGLQFDARYLGKYIQNWNSRVANDVWDLHGYVNNATDQSQQLWRAVYFSMGANVTDMIAKAEQEQKWDFVGVGYVLRALGWQLITDYHGEAIVSQAFEPGRKVFEYDSQEFIYGEVKRLAMLAIANLERTDGAVATSGLNRGDLIYGGDRTKWLKFAYGLLAINEHHRSNKASYDPAKVIEYVNKSLSSNADDATVRFEGSVTTDTNFFGPRRGNLNTFRQSKFIVGLLDGTNPTFKDPALTDPVFAGQHLKDPRIQVMLAQSGDGQYRGVTPGVGVNEYTVIAQRPRNPWNTPTDVVAQTDPGKYLFQNNARFPLMTYAQMQFIKAEAAWIKNDKALALEAYKNGVNAHLDFVRQYAVDDPATTQNEVTLYTQRRTAYTASPALMPATPEGLSLQKIMLQKYIAQWGWGFIETWSDLRRYHYDQDPAVGDVFVGFELPTTLDARNNGKPAYRVRPRFNSEYMWNRDALEAVGGLKDDYHTFEMWFSKKQ